MKRFLVLTAALATITSAIGCNCLRGRGARCAPACMPAPACAPAVSYGNDCAPAYGGGTIVEPYGPTPAGTTVSPGPITYTPSG